MTEPIEIFIVYRSEHIDEARLRVARGATVVCLDFLVEQELKKENISYVSLRDFVDSKTGEEEWWLLAQNVAREWYRLPAMKFFEHKGIRIGEALEPIMMVGYLARLFYYARIYTALKKAYPDAHLYIPSIITNSAPIDGCLVNFERRAVIDAIRMVGLKSTVLYKHIAPSKRPFIQIALKSLLVRAYNVIIGFEPRRNIKIYASEYWSHIGPVIEKMENIELVLMDSEEIKKIPWRQILKHRIRTRHPNNEISRTDIENAKQISKEFVNQWKVAKKEVAEYLVGVHKELDWSPVLEACEYLMAYSQHVIVYTDAIRRIMVEEKPDVILQLASANDRYHQFFVVARAASQLKIPSVELQHASAYIDPRCVYSRLENDYLATYGTATNLWHERVGHPHSRLIPTGSPRFDQYLDECVSAPEKGKQLFKQFGLDAARPVLLAAVPFSDTNLFAFDSYQLAEFFKTIHLAQSNVPDMQALFKCRNNNYVDATQKYLQELSFNNCAVAGNEDIFALLCASDAVICSNSTLIYQTILAKKPIILYPWQSFDTYHAQVYAHAIPLVNEEREVADILARIFTDASYREELLVRQKDFLDGYCFDGKSSERVAALLREISQIGRAGVAI